jgi:hypothetical protein
MQRVGSRTQVMHGNAKQTSGGIKKNDLKYNKQGKIVSKKMSTRAKKEKRLQKAGYTPIKGIFKLFRKQSGGGGGSHKKAKKAKPSGRKKMVTRHWGNGFKMKDILQGRVERGKKTTLKVDGDSLGMPNVEQKNLAKVNAYAKKMGYKKVLVVNFGEGDNVYTL